MIPDVDFIRAQAPGVLNSAYLLNAGAGLMPAPVLGAVREHLPRYRPSGILSAFSICVRGLPLGALVELDVVAV